MNGGSVLACMFQTNLARYGGGAYASYGNEIRDTWFVGNIATATSATTIEGGGLNSMSTPVISNCHFLYNVAARTDCYGGGAYVRYAMLWDCSFTGNGDAWSALITGLVHGDNTVQVTGTNLLASPALTRSSCTARRPRKPCPKSPATR